MEYGTNISVGTEGVYKFAITYPNPNPNNIKSVVTDGYYAANTLYRTTSWDENGTANGKGQRGRTDVYKDKLGRVVLTRKYVVVGTSYQNVDTYNVYDTYGDLVMVVPPESINNGSIVTSLVFEYTFDNQHRLSKKKVPNADWVYYLYNARDLVALMQDGNMRSTSKYLATVYDDLGRAVKTGFVTSNDPDNITISDAVGDPDRMTRTLYYPNSSWVQHQEAKVLNHADLNNTSLAPLRSHVWSYIERRPGYTYTGKPIAVFQTFAFSDLFGSPCLIYSSKFPIRYFY